MSAEFIAHLRDLFAPFAPHRHPRDVRRLGLYRDGTIFAIAIDDAVYLKVDDETRAQFEAAGSAPFVYTGSAKPITMSYWSAPADAVDSPMDMLPWARLAYEAALRKPKGKGRKKAKSAEVMSGFGRWRGRFWTVPLPTLPCGAGEGEKRAGMGLARRTCIHGSGGRAMSSMLAAVRTTIRGLLRRPGYALAVAGTLALGIGPRPACSRWSTRSCSTRCRSPSPSACCSSATRTRAARGTPPSSTTARSRRRGRRSSRSHRCAPARRWSAPASRPSGSTRAS